MTWPASVRTWLAGEDITVTLLNEQLRDPLKELSDAMTSYTPVVTGTGWAAGNAVHAGGWIDADHLVIGYFSITIGSTTTVGSGAYSITVPATAITTDLGVGALTIRDSSVPSVRQRNMYLNTTTTIAAQDESGTFVSGTAPFALANGDTLKGLFVYPAA
jgi:hypothetical protein